MASGWPDQWDIRRHGDIYADVLGIDRSSSLSDVKKAYRKRALECHPDKHQSVSDRFQILSKAAEIVQDQTKRALYDSRLAQWNQQRERDAGLSLRRTQLRDQLLEKERMVKESPSPESAERQPGPPELPKGCLKKFRLTTAGGVRRDGVLDLLGPFAPIDFFWQNPAKGRQNEFVFSVRSDSLLEGRMLRGLGGCEAVQEIVPLEGCLASFEADPEQLSYEEFVEYEKSVLSKYRFLTGVDEITATVVEIGRLYTRIGSSGDDQPKRIEPSLIGSGQPEVYGEQSLRPRPSCTVKRLVENGRYTVEPEQLANFVCSFIAADLPLLLVDPCDSVDADFYVALASCLLERVPAVYFVSAGVTSAYSMGKPNALVVDAGSQFCHVTPVLEGHVLRQAAVKGKVSGDAVGFALRRLLPAEYRPRLPQEIVSKRLLPAGVVPTEESVTLRPLPYSESQRLFLEEMQWRDFSEAVATLENGAIVSYEFCDSFNVSLSDAAASSSIAFIEGEEPPLQTLIQRSIQGVDVDSRSTLLSNIVVVGGGACASGFADRIIAELGKVFPPSKAKVFVPATKEERRFSAWIGGSILSSLPSFAPFWITLPTLKEKGRELFAAIAK